MLSILIGIWLLHAAVLLSPGANVLVVSQLAASDRARSAAFAAFRIAAVLVGALGLSLLVASLREARS
jgi:threonine/homoserine/homoserine lactone efflux protein